MKRIGLIGAVILLALSSLACSGEQAKPNIGEGRLYYTVVEGGNARIEWLDNTGASDYMVGSLPSRSRISSQGKGTYDRLKKKDARNAKTAYSPSVSGNGRELIYMCGRPAILRVVNVKTHEEEAIVSSPEELTHPDFSRTEPGKFIYLRGDSTRDKQNIYVQEVGKSPLSILSSRRLGCPTWSNFGRDLYFTYESSDTGIALYKMSADHPNTNTKKILSRVSEARMSPYGSELAVIIDGRLAIYDIYKKTKREIVHEGGCTSPTWSPSGKKLAFVRENCLYIVDQMGGDLTQINSKNEMIVDAFWAAKP